MPARLSRLFARKPAPAGPAAADREAVAPPLARVPHPARMRRERREFLERREAAIRDLGGLALEMYRRDRFREELLLERCADVIAIEERIHELDSLLNAAAAPRGVRRVPRCKCGAPVPRGAHFCSHCGRPAAETPPAVTCGHCGQPLPADTNFCAFCGRSVTADEFEGPRDPSDETAVRPQSAGEQRSGAD